MTLSPEKTITGRNLRECGSNQAGEKWSLLGLCIGMGLCIMKGWYVLCLLHPSLSLSLPFVDVMVVLANYKMGRPH